MPIEGRRRRGRAAARGLQREGTRSRALRLAARERLPLRHRRRGASPFERARLTSSFCPIMGQIVWSAAFDGVDLAMQSMFRDAAPGQDDRRDLRLPRLSRRALAQRRAVGRRHPCSCTAKCPAPRWTRRESPAARDARGPWIAVTGAREYAMGFGAHYRATPRVVLRADEARMRDRDGGREPLGRADGPHVPLPRQFRFRRGRRGSCSRFPSRREHVVTRTASPAMSLRRRTTASCSPISLSIPRGCAFSTSPSATIPSRSSTSRA